ncbi:MAG: DUF4129 domain-containing protein [Anaerolineae bacterium]
MTERTRRWAILLTGLALVAMVLLAAGLSGLELLPGRTLVRVQAPTEIEASPQRAISDALLNLLYVVLSILVIFLAGFFVFYLLFSADTRKRLLIGLGLAISLLVLWFISRVESRTPEQVPEAPAATAAPTEALATALPFEGEVTIIDLDVDPPAWLVWVGAGALALLVVGALAAIAWIFWSRRQAATTPLEELAREAERAIGALEAGANINDTIMRCYFQMSHILQQQRDIVRPEAMTPREFERGLRGAGLPQEPVARLTRLFEKVRYGAGVPDEDEERQAASCLAAVVEACRSAL